MSIHSFTSSRKPQWAKDEARLLHRDINKLADQVKGLDNKEGVDTNPEDGQVNSSQQEFQTDRFSGKFDGEAEIIDGELKSFRLFPKNGLSAQATQR